MAKLTPIPTPPGTAWREFRFQYLPALMFALVLGATALIWRDYIGPASMVGEVETVRAVISSSQAGRVALLNAGHLQVVATGERLVQIVVADPKVLEAQLNLSKARIELARVTVEPKLRKENNQISYEKLRMDWMGQRIELAIGKSQLIYYEGEFARLERLFGGGTNSPVVRKPDSQLVSHAQYDIAKRDVEVTRAKINELTLLVNDMDSAMRIVDSNESKIEGEMPNSVRAAVTVEERLLDLIETQLAPVMLTSPIDGVVSIVHRHQGESVMAGDPILTISQNKSERINAFLKQPLSSQPKVDQLIEIRARSSDRPVGQGRIVAVGSHLEPILPQLLTLSLQGNRPTELGLPVVISVPDSLKDRLFPGEVVDLRSIHP
ncbi:MAG: HlyD family secretion protein [Pedosphaera sp.]|nr:HlyD family secretion protein [Pedosphaera sp.]